MLPIGDMSCRKGASLLPGVHYLLRCIAQRARITDWMSERAELPGDPPTPADGAGLALLQQAKDLLRRAEAGEREFAERGEFTAAMPREFARSKYHPPQPAGQLLHACRQIDRLANAGEIQTVAAAYIAVKDLAQMQRQPEPQPVEMLDLGRLGQRLDIRLRHTGSGERAAAGFGRVGIASDDRKDRQ